MSEPMSDERIAELRHVSKYLEANHGIIGTVDECLTEITRLKAVERELREDKERLDYLEQIELEHMLAVEKHTGTKQEKHLVLRLGDQKTCWGDTYREAIDAARKVTTETEGM